MYSYFLTGRTRGEFQKHVAAWRSCTKCKIGELCANHVFYRGVIPCEILFLGEAPGENEDRKGYPFVGRAGYLLDKLISQSGIDAFTYAITNTVMCRPTIGSQASNRQPSLAEVENCAPRVLDFISLAAPKVVVALGRVASSWVEENPDVFQDVVHLQHPSFILRKGGVHTPEFKVALEKLKEWVFETTA